MKRLDYLRPSSLEEACDMLAGLDGRAKVLAGGTDLLVQIKQGRLTPDAVISLRDVPGLSFVDFDPGTGLRFGALTPLAAIAGSLDVMTAYPAVATAASWVGSVQVRNRATVGGNLCNAAPSADMAPPLIAYGAQAVVTDGKAERIMPLQDFFIGPGQTALQRGELLKELRVPPAPPSSFGTYEKAYRSAMDIAIAGVALVMVFGNAGRVCRDARVVLGAVAPTPMRAVQCEGLLGGRELSDALIQEAGEKASEEARPISDVRSTAEYRRTLVKVLTRRALRSAHSWVKEGGRA